MKVLKTISIAFSMFSAIPMPQFCWTKENMKYTMCAFPLVGVVIGLVLTLWCKLAQWFEFGSIFFAVGITILPVLITGGIHLDGFCDTVDALASHGDTAKKLAILKDPNTGAFAVIGIAVYFLAYFGLVTEVIIDEKSLFVLALGYILSRGLSAFAIASFPCAKNSGLAHTFADMSAKKTVKASTLFLVVVILALTVLFSGVLGMAMGFISGGIFLLYYRVSIKQFGGITGDLAGWFLQLCELGVLAGIVLTQKLAVMI